MILSRWGLKSQSNTLSVLDKFGLWLKCTMGAGQISSFPSFASCKEIFMHLLFKKADDLSRVAAT